VLFGDRDLGNGNNVGVAPFSVAVDKGGTVYAGSLFANYVLSYAPPISSNSIPATEFDLGFAPVALALNDSGNLAAANWEDGSIALFKAPFSSKVSPSALLKNQLNSDGIVSEPWHLAFDSSGTLWVEWVGNLGNALQSIRQRQFIRKKQGVSAFGSLLTGYTPPFTDGQLPSVVISAGMTQPEGLAINTVPGPYNGSVFVANFDTNSVTMYAPPITSASVGTPLPGSFGGPVALCLDAGGNLYVANATSNTITVYAPPYTDPTNPVATIANGIAAPFTLTVTP
jgi:DNA-binding beta-propeller fold protein YncE